jgi:hypothetical protein
MGGAASERQGVAAKKRDLKERSVVCSPASEPSASFLYRSFCGYSFLVARRPRIRPQRRLPRKLLELVEIVRARHVDELAVLAFQRAQSVLIV